MTAGTLEALKTRRAELDRMAAAFDAQGRNTLVEGEADARPMGFGPREKQTAADADTGLIVHHAVTNEPNDTRQLHPMAKAAKEALGLERWRSRPTQATRAERGGRLRGGRDHGLRAGQ